MIIQLDTRRHDQVNYQCHAASTIRAVVSMITVVMILGVMVLSIPQD
jgi:hypothetical protein